MSITVNFCRYLAAQKPAARDGRSPDLLEYATIVEDYDYPQDLGEAKVANDNAVVVCSNALSGVA